MADIRIGTSAFTAAGWVLFAGMNNGWIDDGETYEAQGVSGGDNRCAGVFGVVLSKSA
jgi:hypothetical protein